MIDLAAVQPTSVDCRSAFLPGRDRLLAYPNTDTYVEGGDGARAPVLAEGCVQESSLEKSFHSILPPSLSPSSRPTVRPAERALPLFAFPSFSFSPPPSKSESSRLSNDHRRMLFLFAVSDYRSATTVSRSFSRVWIAAVIDFGLSHFFGTEWTPPRQEHFFLTREGGRGRDGRGRWVEARR